MKLTWLMSKKNTKELSIRVYWNISRYSNKLIYKNILKQFEKLFCLNYNLLTTHDDFVLYRTLQKESTRKSSYPYADKLASNAFSFKALMGLRYRIKPQSYINIFLYTLLYISLYISPYNSEFLSLTSSLIHLRLKN